LSRIGQDLNIWAHVEVVEKQVSLIEGRHHLVRIMESYLEEIPVEVTQYIFHESLTTISNKDVTRMKTLSHSISGEGPSGSCHVIPTNRNSRRLLTLTDRSFATHKRITTQLPRQ
jgi:hypothetical protein